MQEIIDKLMDLNAKLEHEESKLKIQCNYAMKFLNSLPYPAWVKYREKTGEWKNLVINREYETRYNIKAEDFYLREDSHIWGVALQTQSNKEDVEAEQLKGSPIYVNKTVINPFTNKAVNLTVVKWALMIGTEVVGVAGIVLSEEEI